jgi:hypothetical protein
MPRPLILLGRGPLSLSTGVEGEHWPAAQGLPVALIPESLGVAQTSDEAAARVTPPRRGPAGSHSDDSTRRTRVRVGLCAVHPTARAAGEIEGIDGAKAIDR